MILALVICAAAIVTLGRLLFTCAVYAMPLFVGATFGLAVDHTGSGALGAIAIGAFAAALTHVIGKATLAQIERPLPRLLIVSLFAIPAGVAAFHAVVGITASIVPSPFWRQLFAFVAAIAVAAFAGRGVGSAPPGSTGRGRRGSRPSVLLAGPANDP